MKNCLKSLLVVAVFVAASFVGVKGSAAASGIGQGTTPLGSITINAANPAASVFNVGTTPAAMVADGNVGFVPLSQATYFDDLCGAYRTYSNQPYFDCNSPTNWYAGLDIYTSACANVAFQSSNPGVSFQDDPGWTCSYIDSGSVTSTQVSDLALKGVSGSMPVWPAQTCSSLWANGPLGGCIPATLPTPALSALAGTVATFDVFSNWCSFIAPPSYALANFTGFGSLGCETNDTPVSLTSSTSGSIRMLAASDPYSTKVKVAITSPSDCRVPKVKGLTLRKAKARLHRSHCGVSVRYVKGTRAGRVRYQSLKIGMDRPRGWRIKLAVVR